MDPKIYIYGFCFVAAVSGMSFWRYALDMDDVQKDLLLARQQLNTVEDSLKQTKAWLVARKEAAALIAAASVIKEKNEGLQSEIQAINSQRLDVAKNYMGTIERARAETAGMFLPVVTLTTGASLKNAKIQSIDSELCLLQHSEGVTKVATNLLPDDLQDRLRYGFNPAGIGALSKLSGVGGAALNTSASDRLAQMGSGGAAAPKPAEATESQAAAAVSAAFPAAEGQRSSLGRVYVPGKGWQRAGAGGFVAPPSLSTSTTTTTTTTNPNAVSKVKSRLDTTSSNGTPTK